MCIRDSHSVGALLVVMMMDVFSCRVFIRLKKAVASSLFTGNSMISVSYTHLDVYKRQVRMFSLDNRSYSLFEKKFVAGYQFMKVERNGADTVYRKMCIRDRFRGR